MAMENICLSCDIIVEWDESLLLQWVVKWAVKIGSSFDCVIQSNKTFEPSLKFDETQVWLSVFGEGSCT